MTQFLLMIFYIFYYFNAFNLEPDVPTILICRNGVFMRLENQSVRLVEVASPLAFTVADKLVVITRQVPDIFKGLSKPKLSKTVFKFASSDFAHLFETFTVIVCQLFKFIIAECNFHAKV